MRLTVKIAIIFCTANLLVAAQCRAQRGIQGLSFQHNDWELSCDNTRMCRAAGYHPDQADEGENPAISVLFEREAGPATIVKGRLTIGYYGDDTILKRFPPQFPVELNINENIVGTIVVKAETLTADLSSTQVAALLAALPGNADIEFVHEDLIWHLSDKGAAAVLLKMDEFQGRLGTVGALYKKGKQNENMVPPPVKAPRIVKAVLVPSEPADSKLALEKPLLKAILETSSSDSCEKLFEADGGTPELSVWRLSKTKLVVSTPCWMGAYNVGYGYWVINSRPPYAPSLVTALGTEYDDGTIVSQHKGRGLGDCWSSESWDWDGQKFVHSAQSTTGMCKLVAPGGAWDLPTLVSQVIPVGS